MILKQFTIGSLENNNYLLIDEKTKEAVLIDCTQECEDIENTLKEYNATLKYILLTHGHFDHILGINGFKHKYPDCKVLVHGGDKMLMDKVEEFVKSFGINEAQIQEIDGYVEDNQIIKFGENEIKVIHTPGHTKGGVCYLIGDKLFSGDTLFYESVGRTDLPDGHFGQIKSSIEERLFKLDDNIQVYAGHGPSTTIGHEKINNKFL